jgi:hypothetical protein
VFSFDSLSRVRIVVLVLASAFAAAAQAANAQALPSPKPAPTSDPLTVRAYVRGYDFTRQNASTGVGGANQVNQQSSSAALSLHADYRLGDSPFTVGGSYLYSNPLGKCNGAISHLTPPCGKVAAPNLNPDDTLPGFSLSTFYEAYLQYKDAHLYGKIGDQLINTPWANASDSRLKPAAFQGVDLVYALSKQWSLEAMDMTRFESRTNSAFDNKTLLTSFVAGSPGLPSNTFFAGGNGASNAGFTYGRIGYGDGRLASNLHFYHFADIANLAWFDAKYTVVAQKTKPYLAVQAGRERDTGSTLLGKIDSSIIGVQIGAAVTRNINVSLGYNQIPSRTQTIALPAGDACNAKEQFGVKKGTTLPYFLPSNAPQCINNGNGTATVQYGGIATPYTDSYATDPLFTTSLTQGMADRRAPGSGTKLAANWTSNNKRLIVALSRASYDYGNVFAPQQTNETDADAMYYANRVVPGKPYRGLLVRYRYGERTFTNVPLYGGVPLFKYNRAQLEFDF